MQRVLPARPELPRNSLPRRSSSRTTVITMIDSLPLRIGPL
jgi:hypothetical protein